MGSLHEFRSGREHSSFVPPLASLAVYASLVLVRGDNLRDSLAPEDFSGRPAGLPGVRWRNTPCSGFARTVATVFGLNIISSQDFANIYRQGTKNAPVKLEHNYSIAHFDSTQHIYQTCQFMNSA